MGSSVGLSHSGPRGLSLSDERFSHPWPFLSPHRGLLTDRV